ncbi:MAG: hypothetical protein ABJA78_17365 [Ferruginibacter sp.]
MQPEKNKEQKKMTDQLTPETYDLYAPPVYGKILSIVHKGPIANKILEKVFINTYKNKSSLSYPLQGPLVSLLNQAREESYKTIKALTIFRECCSGATISIQEKK